VDVDRGQLVGCRLENVPVVVDLHELAPVSGRPASRRHRRRFERFAEVGEDLPDRARLGDEGDQPDVAGREWVDSSGNFSPTRPMSPRGLLKGGPAGKFLQPDVLGPVPEEPQLRPRNGS
jgi:hypothetical protein